MQPLGRPPVPEEYTMQAVFACAWNEYRLARCAKFFPAPRACKFGIGRSFGHKNGLDVRRCGSRGVAELPPDGVFGNQHRSARMFEELPLFIGRELIVKRNQHTPCKENGIR